MNFDQNDVFIKSKLVDRKGAKIDDVFGLSPNHVSSTNNGNKYYIDTNLEIFVNAIQ